MRTLLKTALFLALAGCAAPVPMGTPADAVADPRLAGTWREVDGDAADEPSVATVRAEGTELEVRLAYTLPFATARSRATLRGYVFRVDGVSFVNAREAEGGDGGWLLARYDVAANGELVLRAVTSEALEAAATPDEVRRLVRRNLENPSFYGDEARFRRVALSE